MLNRLSMINRTPWLLIPGALFVQAQTTVDPIAEQCLSFPDNTNYCAAVNILIQCTTNGSYGIANCDDRLFDIPPVGDKEDATCWPPLIGTEAISGGDCALSGTAYPDNASPFIIPTSAAATTTSSALSSTETPLATSSSLSPASISPIYLNSTFLPTTTSALSTTVFSQTSSIIQSTLSLAPVISTNTSSSSYNANDWSFIWPSSYPTAECDIFGPLCQTGSIVVGINATTTITTTTMPCSSYLSAQSAYEQPLIDENSLDNYMTVFGRSPQCTSYAQSISYSTYSQCNNASGTLQAVSAYWPAGVLNLPDIPHIQEDSFLCCGICHVDVSQVRVLYWPSGNSSSCASAAQVSIPTTSSTITSSMVLRRDQPLLDNGNGIAIVDGYTFTSPSLYLEVVGTLGVNDNCGPVGSIFTNPIMAVSALSTISYNVPIGGPIYLATGDPGGTTQALNTNDLACPTWGVEDPNGGLFGYTVGPPFMPLIVPPPELLALDPSWATCNFQNAADFLMSYGIFDPPYALTPQIVLGPTTPSSAYYAISATAVDPITSGQPTASPASYGVPSLPKQTAWSPTPEPALVPTDSSHTNSADPGANDPTQTLAPTHTQALPDQVSQSQQQSASTTLNVGFNGPDNSAASTTTINLGGIIYSAFGNAGPSVTIVTANQDITAIDPSIIGLDGITLSAGGDAATVSDKVLSLDQSDQLIIVTTSPSVLESVPLTVAGGIISAAVGTSDIVLQGSTLVPDGPGITILGTPISLVRPGVVVIGTSCITLTSLPIITGTSSITLVSPLIITIGSQTYAADPLGPSDVTVAGYTLEPDAPAVTIDGIPISLAPSGVLVIGTSSNTVVPTIAVSIGQNAYTVEVLGSTEAVVDGATLVAGGPAITISGTPVSLAPSDILIIGTSSMDLAPLSPIGTITSTYISGQAAPSQPLTYKPTSSSTIIGVDYYTAAAPFYGNAAAQRPRLFYVVITVFSSLVLVVV